MAKKIFTDESLLTFVDETKAYVNDVSSTKVNIAQGVENYGKILAIDEEGNATPSYAPDVMDVVYHGDGEEKVLEFIAKGQVLAGNIGVDPSLTLEGHVAEAKAVGDALSALNHLKTYVTPEMFGAKGDGVTDDTEAFLNMLETIYSDNRYNRIVKLSSKTYLLSQPLPINHNLVIFCDSNKINATLKNETSDLFYVPSNNTTDGRIWSYCFDNVTFRGNNNNNFMASDSYQHWQVDIKNCIFNNLNSVFPSIRYYCSKLQELSFSTTNTVGVIGGSDNVFENWVATGYDTHVVDNYLVFDNLYLSRLSNCYFTGSLTSGCKIILKCVSCKDLTINGNWFDYSDNEGLFVETSNYLVISNNTFRGNSRIGNQYVLIKGCKYIEFCCNKYLNVHQGTQNTSASAYNIYDYADFLSNGINVHDNQFEIDYYYNLSLTNYIGARIKEFYEGVDIEYFTNYLKLNESISLENRGVTLQSTIENVLLCNGTASGGNASLYIMGAYGSSDVLFTLSSNNTIKFLSNSQKHKGTYVLMLLNKNTILTTIADGNNYTPANDIEITGVALYIENGKTINNDQLKPNLFIN